MAIAISLFSGTLQRFRVPSLETPFKKAARAAEKLLLAKKIPISDFKKEAQVPMELQVMKPMMPFLGSFKEGQEVHSKIVKLTELVDQVYLELRAKKGEVRGRLQITQKVPSEGFESNVEQDPTVEFLTGISRELQYLKGLYSLLYQLGLDKEDTKRDVVQLTKKLEQAVKDLQKPQSVVLQDLLGTDIARYAKADREKVQGEMDQLKVVKKSTLEEQLAQKVNVSNFALANLDPLPSASPEFLTKLDQARTLQYKAQDLKNRVEESQARIQQIDQEMKEIRATLRFFDEHLVLS